MPTAEKKKEQEITDETRLNRLFSLIMAFVLLWSCVNSFL